MAIKKTPVPTKQQMDELAALIKDVREKHPPVERKQFLIRVDKELLKKCKILAVEQERGLNDIIVEGLRDILKKYSKQ